MSLGRRRRGDREEVREFCMSMRQSSSVAPLLTDGLGDFVVVLFTRACPSVAACGKHQARRRGLNP